MATASPLAASPGGSLLPPGGQAGLPPAPGVARAMPKAEVGALELLRQRPEADGRGVVCAVLDTGVDPAALGMLTTPHGAPKVLDIQDCTGGGDVAMAFVEASAAEDGGAPTVPSSKGQPLRLGTGDRWANPSGRWRHGSKRLFELLPGKLVTRWKAERKRTFLAAHRAATAAAHAAAAEHEAKAPAKEKMTLAAKRTKEELDQRVALLAELAGAEDLGPVVEIVSWHDGRTWRAALDTTECFCGREGEQPETPFRRALLAGEEEVGATEPRPKGLLEDCVPMTDFRTERQFGCFGDKDGCSFCVNIYEDGAVVSLVVDSGSHGTHCAGIVAAYHPEDTELNGVAPGAQVVSLKIGDNRLDGIETGTALTRALIAVLANGCDIINMSFGEPSHVPDEGRFVELARELVHKHGVVFVSSAGNSGPALSTVGAPGGTAQCILGVGAYVSPELAAAGHSRREALDEGLQYSWSSRGPTFDGAVGVAFSAPGGAIAPVPQWTGEGRKLMNGTSMASPNACGAICLLLSALKAQGCSPHPETIRRALENTCKPLPGSSQSPADAVLTSGRGLVQAHQALEYLERSLAEGLLARDVWYEVTVKGLGHRGAVGGRGVYLRGLGADTSTREYLATITPQMHVDAPIEAKQAFEENVRLLASESWITAPAQVLLTKNGRSVKILVDPTELDAGLHYGEVHGYDARPGYEWRGPLFRIPVTVVKPLVPSTPDVAFGDLQFSPGDVQRFFVQVPAGSTWAELTLTAGHMENPRLFMVRGFCGILPQRHHDEVETLDVNVNLQSRASKVLAFKVLAGQVLELTLAQFWQSLGPSQLDARLEFHGVALAPGAGKVHVPEGHVAARVDICPPLRAEKVAPVAKFSKVRQTLYPVSAVVEPLPDERDLWPSGRRIHRLVLTYAFELPQGKHKARLRLAVLNGRIYDSLLEAQTYVIVDQHGAVQQWGDAKPMRDRELAELSKGKYRAKLVLRHDDAVLLKRFKHLAATLELVLAKPVEGKVYGSEADALTGRNPLGDPLILGRGLTKPLFVAPPLADLPEVAKPGAVLAGTLAVAHQSFTSPNEAPGKAWLTAACARAAKDEPPEMKEEDDAAEKPAPAEAMQKAMDAAVKEARLSGLAKLAISSAEASAAFDGVCAELRALYPADLKLAETVLACVEKADPAHRPSRAADVVRLADEVAGLVDAGALVVHFGRKVALEAVPPSERKRMDAHKKALVAAAKAKCGALLDRLEADDPQPSPEKEKKDLGAAFEALQLWVDPAKDCPLLHARREAAAGRPALALQAMQKALAENGGGSGLPKDELGRLCDLRQQLFRELGWEHLAARDLTWRLVHLPSAAWPPTP